MLRHRVGIALALALASAASAAAAPEEASAAPVVKITRPSPTGESAPVFAAKQTVLKGTLAFKCGLDSVYFSADDDTDLLIQQQEASLVAGEITDTDMSTSLARPRKFSGSAPVLDAANVTESSSIPGVGTTDAMGPCSVNERKTASAREYIIRKDKSFADALAALDAKDYAKAASLLQSAYDKIGYPEAAVLLAKLSLNGQGMPRDSKKALVWLDRAAVGRYDTGRNIPRFNPKDPEAMNGMMEGAMLLAKLHLAGSDGVKKDPAEARKWYKKAVDLGYVPALNALGLASEAGVGGARDSKQALNYFKDAAEQGYAPAQFNLARLYALGQDGITRDDALARNWYARAAQSGHAPALTALARIYDLGEGVPADQAKAIVYYKAAALKADPDALSALALYFYEGEQVAKNLETARKLLTEAATRGQREAMFNLAVMLAKGEGGDQDLGMAYVWFSLAKASGHEGAGAGLEDVSKHMSTKDRATADAILKPRATGAAGSGG